MAGNSLIWLFTIFLTSQARENVHLSAVDNNSSTILGPKTARTLIETIQMVPYSNLVGVERMNYGYNTNKVNRNCNICQLGKTQISGDAGLNVVGQNFGPLGVFGKSGLNGGDRTRVGTGFNREVGLGGGVNREGGIDGNAGNPQCGYGGLSLTGRVLAIPSNIQSVYGFSGSQADVSNNDLYRNGMYREVIPKPIVVAMKRNFGDQKGLNHQVYQQGYVQQHIPNSFGHQRYNFG